MHQLDDTDVQILELLQQNGRMTNRELSEHLSISTTPIYERVKKLEKKGFIKKYVALVDGKMIDKHLTAFLRVILKEQHQENVDQFISAVEKYPEVMEAYFMAGESDFLLKVSVKDMDEYHEFIMNKISSLDGCIANVRSSFVMNEIKYTTAFSINGKNQK